LKGSPRPCPLPNRWPAWTTPGRWPSCSGCSLMTTRARSTANGCGSMPTDPASCTARGLHRGARSALRQGRRDGVMRGGAGRRPPARSAARGAARHPPRSRVVERPRRPGRHRGEAIPVAARVTQTTNTAIVFDTLGGPGFAVHALHQRAGGLLDPDIACHLADRLPDLLAELEAAVPDAEPAPVTKILTITCRVLRAADVYQASTERRAHRPPFRGRTRTDSAHPGGADRPSGR
jgi:hypothetical protein